jgi:hypothetical protein
MGLELVEGLAVGAGDGLEVEAQRRHPADRQIRVPRHGFDAKQSGARNNFRFFSFNKHGATTAQRRRP